MARAAFERHVPLERNTDVALNIQERMQVVGSDGEHVGTVDHTESADCIVLTGDDPKAGGKSHVISVEWVDHVDSKVHLNKPSRKAVLEWRIQRHVGRDGISLRGLVDPFDLSAALKASAIHLRDLRNRFGNVGPSHVGVCPHVRRNPLSMAG
jgi:hypothetical protein